MQLTDHRTGAAIRAAALGLMIAAFTSTAAGQAVPKATYSPAGSFQLPARGQPGGPDHPVAIASAPDGTIHIVDGRGLVLVFDSTGAFLRSYGEQQLDDPLAIELGRDGDAYVLDGGRGRIVAFGPNGQALRVFGEKGTRAGQLAEPVDFALGPSGYLFVLDKDREAVQVLSLDGTFVRDIPLRGGVQDPASLAVARDGSVLVADGRARDAIIAFPPFDAIPWAATAARGIARRVAFRGAELSDPVATAVNDAGSVVVLDARSGRLYRRNVAGGRDSGPNDLLYGGSGRGRGSFKEPVDIAFVGRDELIILDRELRKVERITLTTESGSQPLPRHGFPIRVTRVEKGLAAPLLDVGYATDGSPRFLLKLEDRKLTVVGSQTEYEETAYGDSVPVYQPDPAVTQLQITQELGSAVEGVLLDTLVIVADARRDRFAVFTLPAGLLLGTFGDNYGDNRRLRDPQALGVLPDGRIVIGDTGNGRLKIFSADLASLVASYPAPDVAGVAIAPGGGIFVWNRDGTRVGRLDVEEEAVEPLASELLPASVASMTFDASGNLFVLDRLTQRITIIDPTLSRVMVQLGSEGGLDRPTRIRVDRTGNIYVTDEGAGRTAVFRWDVAVAGLAGLDVAYDGQVAELRWQPSSSEFVDGYEIQGSEGPEGPYAPIARTDEPPYRLAAGEDGEPPRYVRVAPVLITGVRGSATEALPLSVFTADAAFERGDYDAAIRFAREGSELIDTGALKADERVKGRLLRIGFLASYRKDDLSGALEWAKRAAAIPMPREELADFLFSLADVYLRLGDPRNASQQLLALIAQDPATDYFSDPAVVDQSFRVYRRMTEAGLTEDALEFLRLYSRSIPSVAPALRRQYADSIAAYSTRTRLGPAIQDWRNASYGQVVSYVEGLMRQGGLSEEEMVVASQLLAAAYYAFGDRLKARDAFRQVLTARPGFDLDAEIPRLQRLYELTIYNTQTRNFFGGLQGSL